MSQEQIEHLIEESLPKLSGLKAVVCFDLGADGIYVVDATKARPMLSDAEDHHCTIKLTAENLGKLMAGRMDPMLAYAMGRIKVSGSKSVAMALVSAIG